MTVCPLFGRPPQKEDSSQDEVVIKEEVISDEEGEPRITEVIEEVATEEVNVKTEIEEVEES